jgi:hypothetical protein
MIIKKLRVSWNFFLENEYFSISDRSGSGSCINLKAELDPGVAYHTGRKFFKIFSSSLSSSVVDPE